MTDKCNIDLLYEAGEIAGFDAANGWPEELAPWQLVALMVGHEWLTPRGKPRPAYIQHPDGRIEEFHCPDLAAMEAGTERAKKRKACGIAAKMLIDAGLVIEVRSETIERPSVRKLVSLSPPYVKDVEQPPEVKRWHVVTRHAVRTCLQSMGKEPPELVLAWLGDKPMKETVVERNRRIAASVLDGSMTKIQAEAEGVKPANLKRILGDERKRRAEAQKEKKETTANSAAGVHPIQAWTAEKPQQSIAKPSPKKKTSFSKT